MFSADASYLLFKTPEDLEEEKAIKEMCYKSGKILTIDFFLLKKIDFCTVKYIFSSSWDGLGEYYRLQIFQENQLTESVPSVLEYKLLKPIETGRDLQEGMDLSDPALHFRDIWWELCLKMLNISLHTFDI